MDLVSCAERRRLKLAMVAPTVNSPSETPLATSLTVELRHGRKVDVFVNELLRKGNIKSDTPPTFDVSRFKVTKRLSCPDKGEDECWLLGAVIIAHWRPIRIRYYKRPAYRKLEVEHGLHVSVYIYISFIYILVNKNKRIIIN